MACIGFGLSVLFAFVLSVLLHFAGWLRRGLMPLLIASQTVPIVALAPLMVPPFWQRKRPMPKRSTSPSTGR